VCPCSKVYCLMKLKSGKSESHFEEVNVLCLVTHRPFLLF